MNFGGISKDMLLKAFEDREKSSERRFERLQDRSAAVSAIREATDRFAATNSLVATIAAGISSVAFPLHQTCFKYSHFDSGELLSALRRIEEGAPVTVALVNEEDRLIAYAIAECPSDGRGDTEVKILDVDLYSRRKSGLVADITMEGDHFQVGVSHVVLARLLKELPGSVVTDATNQRSRYVFTSIGFVHRDRNSNPCILRFPPRD
jgi:hypothetical protein